MSGWGDVLWTEGEYDVYACKYCDGTEGYNDEAEGWIDCSHCEGTGIMRIKRETDKASWSES